MGNKLSIKSKYVKWQSEFDHKFASCFNNHRGWSKTKKMNRRLAKRKEQRTKACEEEQEEQNEQLS